MTNLPISFEVVRGEALPRITVHFGTDADVRAISYWRAPKNAAQPVRDALEFARLASKRWRYYRRSIACISSANDLNRITSQNPRAEIGFILVARAEWFSSTFPVGLVQCRRTFCNNIVVEFLAVHPRVVARSDCPIRGIGTGILYALCILSRNLGVQCLWGEATEVSAPFYRKIFGVADIQDHFHLGSKQLEICESKFWKEIAGRAESP